jgi:hypothetical protein
VPPPRHCLVSAALLRAFSKVTGASPLTLPLCCRIYHRPPPTTARGMPVPILNSATSSMPGHTGETPPHPPCMTHRPFHTHTRATGSKAHRGPNHRCRPHHRTSPERGDHVLGMHVTWWPGQAMGPLWMMGQASSVRPWAE